MQNITTTATKTSLVVQLLQNTTTTKTSSMDELLQNTTTASSCPTSGKYKNNNINILNGQTIAKPNSNNRNNIHSRNIITLSSCETTIWFKRKTILSWLLDFKIIRVGGLVWYKTNLNGTKTYALVTCQICNGAITCSYCGDEFSIWNFEKHLGSNCGQPYDHITLPKTSTSTPACLIDCMVLSRDNMVEQNRCSICEVSSFILMWRCFGTSDNVWHSKQIWITHTIFWST